MTLRDFAMTLLGFISVNLTTKAFQEWLIWLSNWLDWCFVYAAAYMWVPDRLPCSSGPLFSEFPNQQCLHAIKYRDCVHWAHGHSVLTSPYACLQLWTPCHSESHYVKIRNQLDGLSHLLLTRFSSDVLIAHYWGDSEKKPLSYRPDPTQ